MFTFKKAEKLCSKKDIELLYKSGSSKTFYPLKIFWKVNKFESKYPARVLITVPKRLYKRAVDRNLMKRRIREAYRHAKPNFYEQLLKREIQIDILIMYVGKEKEEFAAVQKSLETGLKKISEVIMK